MSLTRFDRAVNLTVMLLAGMTDNQSGDNLEIVSSVDWEDASNEWDALSREWTMWNVPDERTPFGHYQRGGKFCAEWLAQAMLVMAITGGERGEAYLFDRSGECFGYLLGLGVPLSRDYLTPYAEMGWAWQDECSECGDPLYNSLGQGIRCECITPYLIGGIDPDYDF